MERLPPMEISAVEPMAQAMPEHIHIRLEITAAIRISGQEKAEGCMDTPCMMPEALQRMRPGITVIQYPFQTRQSRLWEA